MKLIHHAKNTRLYLGDARTLEGLPAAPDLIIADPPYNFDKPYENWGDLLTRAAYATFTSDWILAAYKALKPGGSLWYLLPDEWVSNANMSALTAGFVRFNWCIWHYRFGQHNHTHFIRSHTHIIHQIKPSKEPPERKGTVRYNPTPLHCYPSAILEPSDRASKYNDPRTLSKATGTPGLRIPLTLWSYSRIQGNNRERWNPTLHPNQIPEALVNRIILYSSAPSSIVLDPFLGSGTSLVCARALHRRFIGIDNSEPTLTSAYSRLTTQGAIRHAK